MVHNNIKPNLYTYKILIDAICKEGRIMEALHMFDMMMERGNRPDAVTYNALMDGYFLIHKVDEAEN